MTTKIDHNHIQNQKRNQQNWHALQRELRLNPKKPEEKPFQAKTWSKNVVCCNDDCREAGVWWRSQELIDYNGRKAREDLQKHQRNMRAAPVLTVGVPGADRPNKYRYSSAGPSASNLTRKERILKQIVDITPKQPKNPEKFMAQLRRCKQVDTLTTETFEEYIKPFQMEVKDKIPKIPKGNHNILDLPRKAVTEFGQYVTQVLYPEWQVKEDEEVEEEESLITKPDFKYPKVIGGGCYRRGDPLPPTPPLPPSPPPPPKRDFLRRKKEEKKEKSPPLPPKNRSPPLPAKNEEKKKRSPPLSPKKEEKNDCGGSRPWGMCNVCSGPGRGCGLCSGAGAAFSSGSGPNTVRNLCSGPGGKFGRNEYKCSGDSSGRGGKIGRDVNKGSGDSNDRGGKFIRDEREGRVDSSGRGGQIGRDINKGRVDSSDRGVQIERGENKGTVGSRGLSSVGGTNRATAAKGGKCNKALLFQGTETCRSCHGRVYPPRQK